MFFHELGINNRVLLLVLFPEATWTVPLIPIETISPQIFPAGAILASLFPRNTTDAGTAG